MEQRFEYNLAYDWKTHTYRHFDCWQKAVMFAQGHKMSLKHCKVVKVEDHYEIH